MAIATLMLALGIGANTAIFSVVLTVLIRPLRYAHAERVVWLSNRNPQLGVNQMLFPSGRSLYNAFQTSLRANVNHPFAGVKAMNWIVSYALSRTDGSALDLDFVNTAIDNNKPTAFFGPNGLDRTHQFSFGGTMDVPLGLRFGAVGGDEVGGLVWAVAA